MRRLLPARGLLTAALVVSLTAVGCGGERSPAAAPAGSAASAGRLVPSGAPAAALPSRVGADPSAASRSAAARTSPSAGPASRPGEATAATLPALAAAMLRGADLPEHGRWAEAGPAAAPPMREARHEYCHGPFASDDHRTARLTGDFARDDGLRVQLEYTDYADADAAAAAMVEFAETFRTCREYRNGDGASEVVIRMSPSTLAPRMADEVTAARLEFVTATGTVPAATAVYRQGPRLHVISIIAEQEPQVAAELPGLCRLAGRRAALSTDQP